MIVIDKISRHATKLLGFAQVTIGAVAVSGIIPEHHTKYWMLGTGLLTAWRGFFNSSVIASAEKNQ